jgi:uncharacterized protein (TIGR03382 family)
MTRSLFAAFAVVAAAGVARADLPELYCTGFEAPDYAVGVLTGQDEWFIPVAGSVDYNVQAYGGTIAPNPDGEANFVSGTPGSTTAFARAQHAASFLDGTAYIMSYDVNVLPWGAEPPALNNIGSFSTQNSTTSRFTQSLFVWNDLNNPAAGWNTQVVNINAAGTNLGFLSPGAEFSALEFNHWYRQSLSIDFATNQLLSISITDLATNTTTTTEFTDLFLGGGANNALGLTMADAIRLFTGGSAATTLLWDNVCVEIVPAPATGALALLGLGMVSRRRRR